LRYFQKRWYFMDCNYRFVMFREFWHIPLDSPRNLLKIQIKFSCHYFPLLKNYEKTWLRNNAELEHTAGGLPRLYLDFIINSLTSSKNTLISAIYDLKIVYSSKLMPNSKSVTKTMGVNISQRFWPQHFISGPVCDGSKVNSKTGYACSIQDSITAKRIRNSASVFTAELSAIHSCLS